MGYEKGGRSGKRKAEGAEFKSESAIQIPLTRNELRSPADFDNPAPYEEGSGKPAYGLHIFLQWKTSASSLPRLSIYRKNFSLPLDIGREARYNPK